MNRYKFSVEVQTKEGTFSFDERYFRFMMYNGKIVENHSSLDSRIKEDFNNGMLCFTLSIDGKVESTCIPSDKVLYYRVNSEKVT